MRRVLPASMLAPAVRGLPLFLLDLRTPATPARKPRICRRSWIPCLQKPFLRTIGPGWGLCTCPNATMGDMPHSRSVGVASTLAANSCGAQFQLKRSSADSHSGLMMSGQRELQIASTVYGQSSWQLDVLRILLKLPYMKQCRRLLKL